MSLDSVCFLLELFFSLPYNPADEVPYPVSNAMILSISNDRAFALKILPFQNNLSNIFHTVLFSFPSKVKFSIIDCCAEILGFKTNEKQAQIQSQPGYECQLASNVRHKKNALWKRTSLVVNIGNDLKCSFWERTLNLLVQKQIGSVLVGGTTKNYVTPIGQTSPEQQTLTQQH